MVTIIVGPSVEVDRSRELVRRSRHYNCLSSRMRAPLSVKVDGYSGRMCSR